MSNKLNDDNKNKEEFKINCIYNENGNNFMKIVSEAFKCYYENEHRVWIIRSKQLVKLDYTIKILYNLYASCLYFLT